MLRIELLALLLLAATTLAVPRTLNDPFRAIALTLSPPPEEPVCCLKPLQPLEPTWEDELLLSFEEWKAKRLVGQEGGQPPAPALARDDAPTGGEPPTETPSSEAKNTGDEHAASPPLEEPHVSAHFSVPLTDRFNYAALDCSARVHAAHRGAKSASAILSSKKDRYMLSPCSTRGQFVVVELCDDIRIDTVQLANFEFFSGVFRDFRVSVAKTLAMDLDGWTDAGAYRAKNVRGVQVRSFIFLATS
jgi:hypothetical protein